MNDPMYEQDLVLHVTESNSIEHREVVGHTHGPAGTSQVALDDGTEVAVDYAETGILANIQLRDNSVGVHLPALIGEERARDAATRTPRDEGRPIPLRSSSARRIAGQSIQPVTPRTRAFGNAVACMSVAKNDGEDRLVRAIATFELARHVGNLQGVGYDDSNMFDGFIDRNLDDAARLIAARWDKLQIRVVQARAFDELAELLHEVLSSGRLDPDVARQLQHAASQPSTATAIDVSTRSGSRAQVRSAGRVRLSGDVQPDRYEIRHAIVSASDTPVVPIASAPIERSTDGWFADLVVPAALTSNPIALQSLLVDLVESGETRPPSFVNAVRLARRAIDSTCDGQDSDAEFEWRESEAEWHAVGETTRAQRARAFRKHDIKVDRPAFLHRKLRLDR